jgi:hypothetical protein
MEYVPAAEQVIVQEPVYVSDEYPEVYEMPYGCGDGSCQKFGTGIKKRGVDKNRNITKLFESALEDPSRIINSYLGAINQVNPVLFGIPIAGKRRRRRAGTKKQAKKGKKSAKKGKKANK